MKLHIFLQSGGETNPRKKTFLGPFTKFKREEKTGFMILLRKRGIGGGPRALRFP